MTILQPNYSGSQLMRFRTKPIDGGIPLTCSLVVGSAETWVAQTVTCSVAEYDYNDFLNISASINAPYNSNYTIEVFQVSASNNTYRKLYQGGILFTTQSTTVIDSEPFVSYTGSKTEYIIYE